MSAFASGDSRRKPPAAGPWRAALRRLRRNKAPMCALGVLVVLVLVALFAPLIAPYAPNAQPDIVSQVRLAPSLATC